MMQTAPPELYMNMQQFSKLKLAARQDSAEASVAVSRQFEGLFVQMMLKNMRSAAVVDESQHSSYMDFYNEMYDKQLAMNLSQQGGIGIANMMQQQMQRYLPQRQQDAAAPAVDGKALPSYRLPVSRQQALPMVKMDYVATNPAVKAHQLNNQHTAVQPRSGHISSGQVETSAATTSPALTSETIQPFFGWQQPDSFVQDVWSHAQKAAAELGVSSEVLVAQSALETGWGRHTMKKNDGSIAFNLFGIKAGSDWTGASVTRNTLEFRSGGMQQETAKFRAYDSLSDAFDDYVSFVKSRPRYADALQHAGSDSHYVRGLQRAGYATDPNYARKIENIMRGDTLKQALNQIEKTGVQYA
jgi:flagellar protein FlgJ